MRGIVTSSGCKDASCRLIIARLLDAVESCCGQKKGDNGRFGWLRWQLQPESVTPNTLAPGIGCLQTVRLWAKRRAEVNVHESTNGSRRRFLARTPWLGAAVVGAAAAPALLAEQKKGKEPEGKGEEEVSTNEDLMREHGVLKRVLLIYDEVIRRIHADQEFPPQSLIGSANIVRKF